MTNDPADTFANLTASLTNIDQCLDDLCVAGYPAIDFLSNALHDGNWEEAEGIIEDLEASGGDEGGFDYLQLVKRAGMDLHEAAREILQSTGREEDFERVEAMRRYALAAAPT